MAAPLSSFSGFSSTTSASLYFVTANTYLADEGTTVKINIDTSGVPDGTEVFYAITGDIDANDINLSLTGNLVISNQSANVTFESIEDFEIEGDESFIITLRTESQSGPLVAISQPITIRDTSTEYGLIERYQDTNAVYLHSTNLPDSLYPYDMSISSNGSLLYVITADKLYQYPLGSVFDASTIQSANAIHTWADDNISGATSMRGMYIPPTGDKLFICSSVSNVVHQYTLTTPWDINSLSYDNKSFNTTAQAENPQALFFMHGDGSKMYILDDNTDAVYQYSLVTAWDVSTATYDNKSFSVTSYETQPNGLTFSHNGDRMFIVGQDQDSAIECHLSTPWDISTAVASSVRYMDMSALSETFQGLFMNPNMDYFYFVAGSTPGTIVQYAMPQPQVKIVPNNLRLNNTIDSPTDIVFSNTGSQMFVMYFSWIEYYSLTDPFNVSTGTYEGNAVISTINSTDANAASGNYRGLAFNDDGTSMYISAQSPISGIYEYSLSTAYDISTGVTFVDRVRLSSDLAIGSGANGLRFTPNGSIAYISNSSSYINQLNLSAPWSINTASADSFYYSSEVGGEIISFDFSVGGTKMYLHDRNDDQLFQYQLTTPWSVNTAVYDNLMVNVAFLDSYSRVFTLNNVTEQFYLQGGNQDTVVQYNFSNTVYYINETAATVDEGQSLKFNVYVNNPPEGASYYYSTNGSITSADLTSGSLTGSLTFVDGYANVGFTFANDKLTEGNETIQLLLRMESTSGPIVANSQVVTVVDTSQSPYGSIWVSGHYFSQASNNMYSTVSWTVPTDVTSISVVTVGAGAYGYGGGQFTGARGGGGGGLSYRNNIAVTPGETFSLRVGQPVSSSARRTAGESSMWRGSFNSTDFIVGATGGGTGYQTSTGTPVSSYGGYGGARKSGATGTSTSGGTGALLPWIDGGGIGGSGGRQQPASPATDGAPRRTAGGVD